MVLWCKSVRDVYPPPLPRWSEAERHDALPGDVVLEKVTPTSAATSKRTLAHPDGFALEIRRSDVEHDAAGYGLHVSGRARAGQLLAIYPGRLYAPPELSESVLRDNDYCIGFQSGWVLDGREWQKRGERFEERLSQVLQSGISPPAAGDNALLRYRNPLGVASYINHVPPQVMPNAMCCELEVSGSLLQPAAQAMLPNDVEPPQSTQSRYVWHAIDEGKVRTLVAIALDDIADEEVYLNYRYNPANKHPSWYWDPDPEAAKRRWQKIRLFALM